MHQTELFGPVLGLMRAESLDHAIKLANGTPYGLTSGIHSLDDREQRKWQKEIIAGNCYINRGITGAIVQRQPFGGTKNSCFGPGKKAGGPNYLFHFLHLNQKALPKETLPVNEWIDNLTGFLERFDPPAEALGYWMASIGSYAYWWEHYKRPQDATKLIGQDNFLIYTPHKKICVRVEPTEKPLDFLRIFAAATTCKVRLEVSWERRDESYAAVRSKVQKFINASSEEEIIFTSGTTESINLIASSFGEIFLDEGDEIIISEMEHHSNIVPWQLLASRKGVRLKWIPINDRGELDLEAYRRLLTKKTKLVSIAHIANATGTLNPIETIIEWAHSVGAKVLIDGAQGAAHLPVDVQKMDVDFYVFSGHKIYGPTGVGILYGKRELLESLPPYQGGGDMIDQVTMEGSSFQGLPLRFEAGTPKIAEVIGLGAAIDYLLEIGMEEVASWEQKLLCRATQKLSDIETVTIIGTAKQKGPIISFVVDGLHALDIGTIMSLKGIAVRTGHLCAQPTLKHFEVPSLARLSFGIYNSFEEIDIFVQSLKEAMLLLQPQLSF